MSLTLPGGSIMGLIGENGAGKTTTIKCILNLVRRDAGSITLMGYDNLTQERRPRPRSVWCWTSASSTTPCAPGTSTPFCPESIRIGTGELFESYLKKFQLPEEKFIKEFSRGMKMKLSLAAALSHRPKLLILDEATAGLDPVVRDEILDEFLGFIQDEEHSILISSHITSDLEKVADYITYLHQGRVVLSEAKDVLQDNYGRVGCTASDLLAMDPGDVVRVRKGSYGCEALVRDRAAFHKKYPQMMVEPISLEDIMLLIGKGEPI